MFSSDLKLNLSSWRQLTVTKKNTAKLRLLRLDSRQENKKQFEEFRQSVNGKMNYTSTTSFTTTTFKVNAVVLCIVNAAFTFAGILLNSVVILSLWNSQLRQKLCYFMILILACCDLAVVAITHPLIILEIISYWQSINFIRSAREYDLINYILALSLIALLLITLERYLALVHPFFHKKSVTNGRLMTAFVLCQLPFVILYIFKLNGGDLPFEMNILYGVMFVALCILNFKLFHIARTVRQRAVVVLGNLDGSNCNSRIVETKKVKVSLGSLGKISTCLLAVVCLFTCNVSSIVRFGLIMADQRQQSNFILTAWAETFLALNSSLNCLIFFYKNSVLRRHGEMFLKKCFGKRSPTP